MIDVELRDSNDNLVRKMKLPFVPSVGDYISAEIDDFFTYFHIKERWIRVEGNGVATACVSVEAKD